VESATRILVIGTSGSGKTTLAAEIAQQLGVPHIELDALHWLPGWVERPQPELRRLVADAAAGENWVADGNYSMLRDILWPRGTMVVWLNYSRPVVMWRVLQRTVRRALFRTPLFSGNRESLRMSFFSRDSILLWAWTSYRKNLETYRSIQENGAFPNLTWVEHESPRQTNEWMRSELPLLKRPAIPVD
jgi:adenylate kinase family enzyme